MRSNLAHPPASWFQTATREGLSLRMLSDEELGDKLAHHTVALAFMKTVYSGDPNGFYGLWHGDTLLSWRRCSDTEKAVEYAQAVEYVDRALFSYERAFFGSFNFTTGLNRLDFDHIDNRPFCLAARQTTDLQI
ncbi:hypothetical protein B0H14DRAFT_3472792 [Mycena olivaceomarginata]|nr:hypothetical protein B0H14DRAFT_3472792 [Mycena olivaceomarginata]